MTDPNHTPTPLPPEPQSAMQRIAALESRVTQLEEALIRAFGPRWMKTLIRGEPKEQEKERNGDEPAGE